MVGLKVHARQATGAIRDLAVNEINTTTITIVNTKVMKNGEI